jgi:nucleoside-diphosphate-sugar epimerase
MHLVITGAGGLVGGRLLDLLTGQHEVFAITRSANRAERAGVRWLTADLGANSLPAGLPARADAVIHLAQSPHYREFPDRALDVFNVNVASTARLLDWSRRAGVRHFVLASSGGVGAATPHNFYLSSRRSAELIASSYAAAFDVLTLRFYFVYGRGQQPGMLVPRLIESVASGQPIVVAGGNGTELNPVHVDDAARAIVRAIETSATGVIDIAGPQTLTIRSMADSIAAGLHRTVAFTVDTTRVPERIVGDITRMSELHAPRIAFAQGIAEMIGSGTGEVRA